MVLFSPTDSWPTHPRAYWRPVLRLARSRGWYLNQYSAHAFGQLRCSDGQTDVCTFKVLTTARSGESAALQCEKFIGRCPHRSTTETVLDVEGCLLEAREHLEKAQRLLDGAKRCQEVEDMRAQVDELVEAAAAEVASGQDLLEQAVGLDEKADEAFTMLVARSRADLGGKEPATQTFVEVAEEHVEAGEALVAPLAHDGELAPMELWIRDLREQIESLRPPVS